MKGGALKDDADWSKLKLKEGQKLMMIGTAGELPKAPEKETVFAEDLPETEQVRRPINCLATAAASVLSLLV